MLCLSPNAIPSEGIKMKSPGCSSVLLPVLMGERSPWSTRSHKSSQRVWSVPLLAKQGLESAQDLCPLPPALPASLGASWELFFLFSLLSVLPDSRGPANLQLETRAVPLCSVCPEIGQEFMEPTCQGLASNVKSEFIINYSFWGTSFTCQRRKSKEK